jgi:hypothetical protein
MVRTERRSVAGSRAADAMAFRMTANIVISLSSGTTKSAVATPVIFSEIYESLEPFCRNYLKAQKEVRKFKRNVSQIGLEKRLVQLEMMAGL